MFLTIGILQPHKNKQHAMIWYQTGTSEGMSKMLREVAREEETDMTSNSRHGMLIMVFERGTKQGASKFSTIVKDAHNSAMHTTLPYAATRGVVRQNILHRFFWGCLRQKSGTSRKLTNSVIQRSWSVKAFFLARYLNEVLFWQWTRKGRGIQACWHTCQRKACVWKRQRRCIGQKGRAL